MGTEPDYFQPVRQTKNLREAREKRTAMNILARIDTLQGREPSDCEQELMEIAADIVNGLHPKETGKIRTMQGPFGQKHDRPDLLRAILNLTKKDFEDAPEYCVAVAGALLEKKREN